MCVSESVCLEKWDVCFVHRHLGQVLLSGLGLHVLETVRQERAELEVHRFKVHVPSLCAEWYVHERVIFSALEVITMDSSVCE